MSKTEVVNVRNHSFLKCIYVGRWSSSKWGIFPAHPLANPFKLDKSNTRQVVLELYKDWLHVHPQRDKLLRELAGKVEATGLPLGCWCHPELCHAHVLAEEVDKILASRTGKGE